MVTFSLLVIKFKTQQKHINMSDHLKKSNNIPQNLKDPNKNTDNRGM